MKKTTREDLLPYTDNGERLMNVRPEFSDGVETYFFYRSGGGPNDGWWLFKTLENGEEEPMCDVNDLDMLEYALTLFRIKK